MLFALTTLALADQAAPEPQICSLGVATAVPGRNTTDLPLDLEPVLFLARGCGEEVRAEILDADGVVRATTTFVAEGEGAIELDAPSWTVGAWSIEVTEVATDFVIDAFDFQVADRWSTTPDAPEVQTILPWSDGNDLRVEVLLDRHVENGIIEVVSPEDTVAWGPTDLQTLPVFPGAAYEGEQCFGVRVRGPGGDFSERVEACAEVQENVVMPLQHQFLGCLSGGGCNNLGGVAPGGLLFLAALVGLRRRD